MPKPIPCKECPFRRDSPPGWLGSHETSREIAEIVLRDEVFPCHMEVTKKTEHQGESFESAVNTAPLCMGSIAFLNNQIKLSRNERVSWMQKFVGKRKDCFQWAHEMEEHHGK